METKSRILRPPPMAAIASFLAAFQVKPTMSFDFNSLRFDLKEPVPWGYHNFFVIIFVLFVAAWTLKVLYQIVTLVLLRRHLALNRVLQLEGMSMYAKDFQQLFRKHFNQLLHMRRTNAARDVTRHDLSMHLCPESLELFRDRSNRLGVRFKFDTAAPCTVRLCWGVSATACYDLIQQLAQDEDRGRGATVTGSPRNRHDGGHARARQEDEGIADAVPPLQRSSSSLGTQSRGTLDLPAREESGFASNDANAGPASLLPLLPQPASRGPSSDNLEMKLPLLPQPASRGPSSDSLARISRGASSVGLHRGAAASVEGANDAGLEPPPPAGTEWWRRGSRSPRNAAREATSVHAEAFAAGVCVARSRPLTLPAGIEQQYRTPDEDLLDPLQLTRLLVTPASQLQCAEDAKAPDDVVQLVIALTTQGRRRSCEDSSVVQGLSIIQAHTEITCVKLVGSMSNDTVLHDEAESTVPSINMTVLNQCAVGGGLANRILGMYGFEEEQDESVCLICFDQPKNVLLLPCRHCLVCSSCLRSLPEERCPLCRSTFSAYLLLPRLRDSVISSADERHTHPANV